MLVPTGNILFQSAGPQVAVVDAASRVQLHKVAVGRDFGDNIEVVSGLREQDTMVANPPDFLIDGMPVSPQAAGAAKAGSQ